MIVLPVLLVAQNKPVNVQYNVGTKKVTLYLSNAQVPVGTMISADTNWWQQKITNATGDTAAVLASKQFTANAYQTKGSYLTTADTNADKKPITLRYAINNYAPIGTVSFPGFGTTNITSCIGNDSRLSDARTPTAHNQAVSTISDATTIGQNFVKLTNPSAITFPRFNANNTVDALSAHDFNIALGIGNVIQDSLTAQIFAISGLVPIGSGFYLYRGVDSVYGAAYSAGGLTSANVHDSVNNAIANSKTYTDNAVSGISVTGATISSMCDVSGTVATALSTTSIYVSWTLPIVRDDSTIIEWNTTGYASYAMQTNRAAVAKGVTNYTITGVPANTKHFVNVFTKDTLRNVYGTNTAQARDTALTPSAGYTVVTRLDSSSAQGTINQGSIGHYYTTVNITVTSASNMSGLIVGQTNNALPDSIYWGANKMTLGDDTASIYSYVMVAPPSGATTIKIYGTPDNVMWNMATTYADVNQTTPVGTIVRGHQGYNNFMTTTATLASTKCLGFAFGWNWVATATPTASMVTFGSPMYPSVDAKQLQMGIVTGQSGATVFDWSFSDNVVGVMLVIPINSAN